MNNDETTINNTNTPIPQTITPNGATVSGNTITEPIIEVTKEPERLDDSSRSGEPAQSEDRSGGDETENLLNEFSKSFNGGNNELEKESIVLKTKHTELEKEIAKLEEGTKKDLLSFKQIKEEIERKIKEKKVFEEKMTILKEKMKEIEDLGSKEKDLSKQIDELVK